MTRALGRTALLAFLWASGLLAAPSAHAQEPVRAVLHGRALLGDSVLRSGTAILHRVTETSQGEVDSVRIAPDGSFTLGLPAVPDPEKREVYFASLRHAGILYFGRAVTHPIQLDSLYEIQAYDTLSAPPQGAELPVQARSIFLERGEGDRWRATDIFEVRNDLTGTLVAREGGTVWRHPLPERAEDAEVSRTDLIGGGAEVRGDTLVVSAPVPPGERLFVVRYTVPDPFLVLPIPSRTETLEIMVGEPAPAIESTALRVGEPAELEPGRTFRRLTGGALERTVVRLTEGRPPSQPPVRWFAVGIGLLLAGVGLWAARSGAGTPAPTRDVRATPDRRALILEVARLDEGFASRNGPPSAEERGAYEARRRELLRRLRALG